MPQIEASPFLVHELGAHQYEEALACLTHLRTVGLSYILFNIRSQFESENSDLVLGSLAQANRQEVPGGRRKGLPVDRLLKVAQYIA